MNISGTELPGLYQGPAPLAAIEAAVGAVLRMEPPELRASVAARRACLRAAWHRENTDVDVLAAWMGVARRSVFRAVSDPPNASSLRREPIVAAALRATGDPRFGPLVLPPRADPTRWAGWRVG